MNVILTYLMSIFSLLLYLVPGIVISHAIAPSSLLRSLPKRLYVYFITSISFSTLLGFVIRNLVFSAMVKIVYIISVCVAMFLLVKRSPRICWNADSSHRLLVLLPLVLSVFFLILHSGYVPRGWDAANHYVLFRQFLLSGTSSTEIGVLTKPFYPRGFSAASAVFASILDLDPSIAFKIFCSILLFTLPFAAYTFAEELFSGDSAKFSALASLMIGYLFLPRGNFPFLLAFLYLGVLLILTNSFMDARGQARAPIVGRGRFRNFGFFWMIITSVLMTHPSVLLFYVLVLASTLVHVSIINPDRNRLKIYLYVVLLNLVTLVIGVTFFLATQTDLFLGYLDFLRVHEAGSEALNQLVFRATVREFFILDVTPYLIFPFIVGLFVIFGTKSMRERTPVYSGLLLVSSISIFTNVIHPLNAREIYYIFYAFTSAVGVGLQRFCKDIGSLGSTKINKQLVIKSFVFALLTLAISDLFYSSMGRFSSQGVYIYEGDVEFAYFLEDSLEHERIAAIGRPNIRLLEALTSHKFIVGDMRYSDINSFRDIYQIFSTEADDLQFWQILQGYNITAILTDGRYSPISLTTEIIGKLTWIDGVDDSGNYGNPSNLQLSAMSISIWFKPLTKEGSLITKGTSRGSNALRDWDMFGDGKKLNFIVSNGTDAIFKLSTSYPTLNAWHNVVAVWDGTTDQNSAKLYMDGVLVDQQTPRSKKNTNSFDIFVGGSGTNAFNGSINGVCIYNVSLTADDVQQNIVNFYNPVRKGLVLWLPMEEETHRFRSLTYESYTLITIRRL